MFKNADLQIFCAVMSSHLGTENECKNFCRFLFLIVQQSGSLDNRPVAQSDPEFLQHTNNSNDIYSHF